MGQHSEADFIGIIRKTGTAFLGIVLVGLAFSQVVALSIIRPIMQLGAATEKLSQQNWETKLPVKGTDEIGKLGLAFNQMAQAVEQRDASLSRGNRGLFMLHRTGHGRMECLDRDTLIDKIAVRAEDLVQADAISVSLVDNTDRMLKYCGVFGDKSGLISGQESPSRREAYMIGS